ncbi:8-oxoguanine glycosylase ogg1 [Basidiobolus ranarum]|uniref:DNA-(apurinic or apyrimidinic site) lyase n=1 Tax=Basidiobolus ranarum TaxID=34480 RepID=A0ABR2WR81_9FUNG
MTQWNSIKVHSTELHLDTTLNSGQTFRWKKTGETEWSNVLNNTLVTLRQTEDSLEYCTYSEKVDGLEELLTDYFQLKVDLDQCYKRWNSVDENFANKSEHFLGIRILRQDPVENLISFICSSNNNIKRISQMVEKLCVKYGDYVGKIGEESFFTFPELEKLKDNEVELELRKLGFGYRAKFIRGTANHLVVNHSDPRSWLLSLRDIPYSEVHAELMKLPGVGAKVADCVCLMSLDKHEAIPVDTHVWQIAKRDYGFLDGKPVKSLTPKIYTEVGNHFRDLFGEYSGWAHSVLFTADLKSFGDRTKKRDTTEAVQLQEKKVKIPSRTTVTTTRTTLLRSRKSV